MRTQRTAVTAALLAATVLVAGCGAGGGPDVPQEASGTLEQLAERARCDRPDVRTDSAELRQASCATDDGKYVLLTFATDRGQRDWINQAKDYGGSYLVGRRWVVAGDERTVTAVRGRLGGTVETAPPHRPQGSHGSHGSHH
ncbi:MULTISPECIES: hypothetical protein [Streptomyces]|uniref:Lipoprotein n=1 Tax=Streptomyces solicathayae TaxID=3081768 RepID=A0ABZ0LZ91_9ACTN|nr:hypothetical protein [Streptomyces sp. HUAS YS2]WOX24754.1 hypothetical protein R2D22_26595 [Streptomyces sp. HUAS YS2]